MGRWRREIWIVFALVLVMVIPGVAQTAATPKADSAPSPAAAFKVDTDELTAETQQTVKGPEWTGLVWWIPTEFWTAAAGDAGQQFRSLDEYTVLVVGIGKIGAFGNINFLKPEELRKNLVLRDSNGGEYGPVEKVSADAEMLSTVIRPMFAKLLGSMGENLDIIYYPAKTKSGARIAQPKQKGSFTFVLKNVMGADYPFTWNTPLNSLQAPRYCPVGKERVNANWNYCPWHGVQLNDKK